MDNIHSPQKRFIRLPEVMEKIGLRRTRIYTLMEEGDFPKCVKLGKKPKDPNTFDCRRVAWLEKEVDQWMDSRLEERTTS